MVKGEAEAKDHISKLRRARHFNDVSGTEGDANARTLARALDMLSAQLYSKPTHFILEIIQNADDNKYGPKIEPTLTLIYREDGYLWVGCNETGFTREDVSAICEIADSTKKATGAQKGYIGEKGIGFKSVFKVADTVWVSSGAYSFKFNRDDLLGMIVPIWSKFKTTKLLKERTMFCLHIPDASARTEVRANLLSLGAELLLFLRKLRHVHVRIVSADEKASTLHEYELYREDTECDMDTEFTTTLLGRRDLAPEAKVEEEKLAIFRHTASKMPAEAKREGITESEIVMAFPTNDSKTYRRTYNFLPIRDYGLPFLLQADFILTANRQDIIEHNLWNDTLKQQAYELFIQCIDVFNESQTVYGKEAFKHTWPKYTVSTHRAQGTIMENFLSTLRNFLRDQPVLQSQRGNLRAPKSLVIVPDKFCDAEKRPLIDDPENLDKYASPHYSTTDIARLGVNTQVLGDFCKLLSCMPEERLHAKPAAWHSKLATALSDATVKSLGDIKLIPVRGGRWVAPSEGQVYFPESGGIEIPDGIECLVVDDVAIRDSSRKKLFEKLGVKKITSYEVCKLIIKCHEELDGYDLSLPLDCLVADAWYIFMAKNYIGLRLQHLQLVKEDGITSAAGHSLYMDSPNGGFKMSQYFPTSSRICEYLHPNYVKCGPPVHRAQWHRWLQTSLGVATIPRLTDSTNPRSGITPAFQYLIDKHPSFVWLTLLRDNWDQYCGAKEEPPEHLKLGKKSVSCTNGQRRQLKNTYLAKPEICGDKFAATLVDFVDVPDPENPYWEKLRCLGLHTEPDLGLCISILQKAAKMRDSMSLSQDYIDTLFHQIERHSYDDPKNTWAAFHKEALIPVKYEDKTLWLRLGDCRWTAPACLRSVVALDQHFPALKEFFCKVLTVQNATVLDIVDEIRHKAGDRNNLDAIRALLLALSEYIEACGMADDKLSKVLQQLQGNIFPVRRAAGESRLASIKDSSWFIADRNRLFRCFQGKIWLLDIDTRDTKMILLFEKLGLTSRYLSAAMKEETKPNGTQKLCKALTQQLQAKAKYISLIVRGDSRKLWCEPLRRIQVWSAKDLVLYRHVVVDGRSIYGQDETGRVILRESGHTPLIFVPETNDEMPWSFISESLLAMMELDESRKAVLLGILTTTAPKMIQDILERANLWEEEYVPEAPPRPYDEDDDMDDEENFVKPKASQETSSKIKEEKQEPSELPARPPVGKSQRAKALIPSSSKLPKPSGGKSSSPKGTRQREDPTDAVPDLPEQQPAESGDSLLIKNIVEAAEGFDLSTVSIVGTETGTSPPSDSLNLLQSSFDSVPGQDTTGDEFNFQGELFLLKVLQTHFDAPETSWTSPHRSRLGLPDIDLDNTPTPFTISDPTTVQHLTNHLINHDITQANDWLGEDMIYHMDVATTTGPCAEPLVFSNDQLDRAREWRDSDGEHVHVLVRVYHLGGATEMEVYVNPLDLILDGQMEVSARGGYYLRRKSVVSERG